LMAFHRALDTRTQGIDIVGIRDLDVFLFFESESDCSSGSLNLPFIPLNSGRRRVAVRRRRRVM
jgi:hypothetical protein